MRVFRCLVVALVLTGVMACGGDDAPTGPSRVEQPRVSTGNITGNLQLEAIGTTTKLVFTVTKPDGTTEDQTIQADWTSSNSAVASVYRGVVTAKGLGGVDITASYQGTTARVTVSVTRSKINLSAVSDGQARFSRDGNAFHTGPGYGGGWRGFNVAAINPGNGELLGPVRGFDTWAARTSGTAMRDMVGYIKSLPNGTVIMIAVSDEAGINDWSSCGLYLTSANKDGLSLLESLGATQIRKLCYRGTWSMITVKGSGRQDEKVSPIGEKVESIYLLPIRQ